jgi:hypothetical protein
MTIDIFIRPAMLADAPALYNVKQQLRMPRMQSDEQLTATQQGGFLLGTSLPAYERFIQYDDVLVADAAAVDTHQVVGFSITLAHESVVNSTLWQRAQDVHWDLAFRRQWDDRRRVAFFEQLAFLPDPAYRVYAKYLAFAATQRALARHDSLFTTIVHQPIHNHASLPFMQFAGFELVGCLDETYPEYGHIVSDIYHLSADVFTQRMREGHFATFVARTNRNCHRIIRNELSG